MNKFLFPLFVILLLAACQDEAISPAVSGSNQRIETRSTGNQVSVCHNGNNIHINSNAVPAHQAHGDAVDLDDDGYFDLANACGSGVDCNDNDPAIYPGAAEVWEDGIDNNCDGQIDEGCIPSVTICGQVWMSKNLDVATYRNGDPIPKVTDGTAWVFLTTGAYCYYNNDSATYAATYGKIYNWYAVNDPRGLAPEGWHVPSNSEWSTLGSCLGGDLTAGGPLKETGTEHWQSPNAEATNSTGFTGLPGGYRTFGYFPLGHFDFLGFYSFYWSSTSSDQWTARFRTLNKWNGELGGGYPVSFNKAFGMYVRCVQD